MANIKILSVQPEYYRGGWNVLIEISNLEKGISNLLFYWKEKDKPNDKLLENKLRYFSDQYDEPIKPVEKDYLQSDIDKILRDKKYFNPNDKFPEDLPEKSLQSIQQRI